MTPILNVLFVKKTSKDTIKKYTGVKMSIYFAQHVQIKLKNQKKVLISYKDLDRNSHQDYLYGN